MDSRADADETIPAFSELTQLLTHADSFKMPPQRRWNDAVHMYINELTSRVVAASGIPSDRFHLGKLILQALKDAPDFIGQIDGGTGDAENFKQMLNKSVQCATSFRSMGVGTGDVIVIMAPNHLDVSAPFYAALYLGITVAAVDGTLGPVELQGILDISRPKVIFCQREKASDIQLALSAIDLGAKIVAFNGGDDLCSFQKFMDSGAGASPDKFKPADFDSEENIAFLISTSGTTGLPKVIATTHKNIISSCPYMWIRCEDFPTPTRMTLIGSPTLWLTAIIHFVMSVIIRYTRLQTSRPFTREHFYFLVNTYKPTWTILSPTFMAYVIKTSDRQQCDFTCLETIRLGGSAVSADLIQEIKQVAPNTEVFNAFGMSESTGMIFCNDDPKRPWICGKPLGCLNYRLVDPTTGFDVTEPNVAGELWLKGPGVFKGYYKNVKATAEAFAEGHWFKTGDILYRDEHDYYVFEEKIKSLLKYMSFQISPIELEGVILKHPGVLDVGVTGIPDPICGELPVALVVRREGHDVTAQEIKDLVKDTLSDAQQLRGGVIFVNEIPMTASTKIHRQKLKEIVTALESE